MILFISIKENFKIQFIVCFPFHLLNICSICFHTHVDETPNDVTTQLVLLPQNYAPL